MTNSNATPYTFSDPASYMSIGDVKLPLALELRAKSALAELEDVKREFDLFVAEHETAQRLREESFDDAMSHYQNTKNEWVRIVDEEGTVHWVHGSSFVKETLPQWLEEVDVLNWGQN